MGNVTYYGTKDSLVAGISRQCRLMGRSAVYMIRGPMSKVQFRRARKLSEKRRDYTGAFPLLVARVFFRSFICACSFVYLSLCTIMPYVYVQSNPHLCIIQVPLYVIAYTNIPPRQHIPPQILPLHYPYPKSIVQYRLPLQSQ